MSLVALVVVVTCIAMGVYHYWQRDADQAGDKAPMRPFLLWLARGLLAPLLVWSFFNAGIGVSPLIPQISQAQAAGKWANSFFPITAGVLFVIASWWAAVSLAWISFHAFYRSDRRREMFATSGVWLLAGIPLAALIVMAAGGMGAGLAAALCFGVVAHSALPLLVPKLPPSYSKALAKIAFDKFNEAEWEIINQLERSENDFDGWMLLADLYASHFHDMASAERTICELCDDPKTTPPQAAVALNRLADWHLKLADNPAHARWALQRICDRLPGTHMASMATLRMSKLPSTRDDLVASRNTPILKLTAVPDLAPGSIPVAPPQRTEVQPEPTAAGPRTFPVPHTPDLPPGSVHPPSTAPDPGFQPQVRTVPFVVPVYVDPKVVVAQEAQRFVEQLTADPNDVEVREKYARLLAESLGRPESGIEQIELLLGIPNQGDDRRAGWLAVQADWHARLCRNPDAARSVLQRIIRDFPQSRAAFEAQRRLYVLEIESAVKLRRRTLKNQ